MLADRSRLRARVLARRASYHQAELGGAFAEGLERHGWAVDVGETWRPSDLLIVWGVRRTIDIAAQRRHGGAIVVLERGYIGDRFAWTSVSFGGGLNGRAEFRGAKEDGARFEKHHGHLMRDWQHRDGYALLIGQVPNDMSLAPVKGRLDGWYRETAAALKAAGWDVRFRPHPVALEKRVGGDVPGVPTIGGTLDEALAGAGVVVTFNSNTAVDAVLAGVPAITVDEGSMAWPVTGHEISDVLRPDRGAWAARLAWCQYSDAEMRSGECWAAVNGL